jgi:UDP-N-acetylglucosamine 4,6-dehydratase
MLTDRTLLITGGTGSFGHAFTRLLLAEGKLRRVIILSRDECKQAEMRREFDDDPRLRFFLGDVRDKSRLLMAFRGVDFIVHAAAMKRVEACEYDPFEAVKTNVLGAQNVIEAAIERGVGRVVALSTDKACSPLNLYGASKACSEHLFTAGNAYSGEGATRFSVVRYGNVLGSRGSVVPLFREQAKSGSVTLTDPAMTRFWITLEQAARFVLSALERMTGGEIFVPRLPACRMPDLAAAVAPGAEVRVIGLRPGEKLHETLITEDEARHTLDRGDHYVILPEFAWRPGAADETGEPVPAGWRYSSDASEALLDVDGIRRLLDGSETGRAQTHVKAPAGASR